MDEMPLTRKIIAFVLTLIGLPVLFVGTCVPIGLISNGPHILIAILAFTALFIAAAISIAVRTKNPGIRWAIIVLIAVAAIAAAVWGIQLYLY
jgi:hypothetical protein